MFRNHLHPVVLFSCIALALGVFCASIAGQIYYDRQWNRYRYDGITYDFSNWPLQDLILFFALLGIGSFLLTSALGLIFRKNWARYLMQFGFIIAALGWLAFVTDNYDSFQHAPVIFIGITASVLGCVIGALLFLNNADWVLPYFQKSLIPEPKKEVLDQDLWE